MNKNKINENKKLINEKNEKNEKNNKNDKNDKNHHKNKDKNRENNDSSDDSSDISSYNDNNENYENMTNDEISQRGKDKFFKTELMEKIIKYIKIDDSIKDKQKEVREQMKVLKNQKEEMEKYIITYLESINEEYVNIDGAAKLTRTITNTKGAINYDNIKLSLIDSLKKQNIEENKISDVLGNVVETIEKNRPVKTRTYIKRTKGAANKSLRKIAQKNKNDNNINNINNINNNDDDIPQYKSN